MSTPGNEGALPAEAAAPAMSLSMVSSGIRLPDDALLVRGGLLQLEDLANAVEVAIVKLKRPGLSVFAVDVDDPQTLLDTVGRRVPHPTVSFSRMGRLRQKGFEIEQTLVPPHHSVWLPEEDDRQFWLREFRNSFDLPRSREGLDGYEVGCC